MSEHTEEWGISEEVKSACKALSNAQSCATARAPVALES